MEKFSAAQIEYKINVDSLEVVFSKFAEKIMGKQVEVVLCYGTFVKEDDPENHYEVVGRKEFFIDVENTISFYDINISKPTYSGKSIDIDYFLMIKINDKLIFRDTQGIFKLEKSPNFDFKKLSFSSGTERKIIDTIDYSKTMKHLPVYGKIIMFLCVSLWISLILMLFTQVFSNFEFVQQIHNEKLQVSHKILIILINFFFLMIVVYLTLLLAKSVKYTLEYTQLEHFLSKGVVNGLLKGKVLLDMINVEVSISVSNYEMGKYYVTETVYDKKTGHSRERRTLHSFERCVSNYTLFEKKFKNFSKGESLEYYVKGKLNKEEFFSSIAPNIYFEESKRGYGVKTKITLLISSPEYKDVYKKQLLFVEPNLFSTNNLERTKDFSRREEIY